MPRSSQTIILPTTDAITVHAPYDIIKSMVPCTISATNLDGSESVTISFSVDGGKNFEASFQEGSAVELTATIKQLSINSPVYLGITKSSTSSACGVFFN